MIVIYPLSTMILSIDKSPQSKLVCSTRSCLETLSVWENTSFVSFLLSRIFILSNSSGLRIDSHLSIYVCGLSGEYASSTFNFFPDKSTSKNLLEVDFCSEDSFLQSTDCKILSNTSGLGATNVIFLSPCRIKKDDRLVFILNVYKQYVPLIQIGK